MIHGHTAGHNTGGITPAQIADWLRKFGEPGQVMELRALHSTAGRGRPCTVAGFYGYDHLDAMARQAVELTPHSAGVYFTLNRLDPDLLARRANKAEVADAGTLTADKNVLRRCWLLIDPDPVRVTGVSSTDGEKEQGGEVTRAIRDYLQALSWPAPVFADSGNSFHLLYRIDVPADDGGLVQRVLLALAHRFDSQAVKIDTAVFNPARICKLYGTWARKGDNVPDRPHRLARILEVPDAVQPVPALLLEQLAAEAPPDKKPASAAVPPNGNGNGHYRHRLKVPEWLTDRKVAYTVKGLADGRTAYLLAHCPFDPSHTGKEVAIFQDANGKMGAKCFHNSCSGRHWQEFKEAIGKPEAHHYDPPLPADRRSRRGTTAPPANGHAGPSACGGDRPTVAITTDEHLVNDEAVKALAADPSVFQRGGLLVREVRDASPAAKGIRRPFTPRIEALPTPLLRERLAANACWVTVRETNEGAEERPAHPPGWCVAAVHARADWPDVRHLEAVVDYPVLRPDGTILECPGYDRETGLLLELAGEPPPIPPRPTRQDALAVRDDLLDVVADFPFEGDVHQAAWLAALLTPLARFAFAGPTPLFLVDANVRAAGKGLLLDCICQIVTGERFTIATYTGDEDELRKRITSLALAGDRLVLFDNLEGKFGNAVLDAALTGTAWKDRVLGVNRMAEAPLYMTWYATGNNVSVAADTARRICHVRLESPEEHPEERQDFLRPNLLAWVGENRPRLLAAALTVLRAYCVAGRPDQDLPAWGSFEGWSGLVRSAVVWIGLPDPGRTRLLLQDQADSPAEKWMRRCCGSRSRSTSAGSIRPPRKPSMSYKVIVPRSVKEKLAAASLPGPILDELRRFLREELAADPKRHLRSINAPVRMMQYNCRVTAPGSPPCVHQFLFRVQYGQDEESLIIVEVYHFPLTP
jgi:hypothetical protein